MLYYVGYYNCDQIRNEDRIVAPAAENKMSYIISALLSAQKDNIEVVTPAETKLNSFVKGRTVKLNDRTILKTFSSFNNKSKLIRIIGHLFTRIYFFLYLILKITSEDQLIVYHSLSYMKAVAFIRKIKKCNLIIEVEELYSDVFNNSKLRKKEIKYLQIADSYLFITELLKNEVNTQKNSVISHGTYRSVKDIGQRFDDDKIHVVYAGTFRKAKGGVYTAIAAAEYLNDNFVLEILGGGSDEEISDVRNLIKDVSAKTTCKINYAGYKTGDEFNKYVQACHIGLSTQLADAKFGATSFPSKVLMYMSNGLKVVSIGIPAVETSLVGKYIYYYKFQDAKAVADAVKSVKYDDGYDSRKILDVLHRDFVFQLNELLGR